MLVLCIRKIVRRNHRKDFVSLIYLYSVPQRIYTTLVKRIKLPPQNGLGDGSLENRVFQLSDMTNNPSARELMPLVPVCGLCFVSGSNCPRDRKSPPGRQVPPRWACSQKRLSRNNNDSECFGFCDFTTQESISCFGSGIQPRIVLGIGQVFARLCFDAVRSFVPAIHPLLCPVKFPYYSFVSGSPLVLEIWRQFFAGFAIPQYPVTIQCFLLRLWDEESAAAMAESYRGFSGRKCISRNLR